MLSRRFRGPVPRLLFMLVAASAGAAVFPATVVPQSGGPEPETWHDYGGRPDNSHFTSLTQINKTNVSQLEAAWTYSTSDNVAYVFNPVIVDDVMYVLARNNSLVALDASTGRELWIHDGLSGISPRGINYWESRGRSDRRLLYVKDNYLEAIDAKTGKSIPTFGIDGAVNLREGLGRDPATVGRVQSKNPGKIFENLLILGSATGENYVATPGDLRAFDVITGKVVWQFHTIPHPGEFGYDTWPKDAWKYVGGVNTWGEISVDPVRGIAYFPLGSPTFDYYGADRPGQGLYGTSLLALDARTGKRLWHFQMVHHDLWDYDNTAAPQLTTVRHNGQPVDVVAEAGKTGFLYVFNRVTGEPLWPIEERPVPRSEVPGEASSPTQPFPTAPPPFAMQRMTVDDINPYLPEAEREMWKTRIANARKDGLFTPTAVGVDTVAIPGAQGGGNWGATSANPTDGTVYVLGINVPSIYNLTADEPGRAGAAASPDGPAPARGRGAGTAGAAPAPPAPGLIVASGGPPGERPGLIGSGGMVGPAYPAGLDVPSVRYYTGYGMVDRLVKPPFSTLTAFDLNVGTIKWQVPAGGDDPQAAAQGAHETGYPRARAGIIVTSTGLLFQAGGDGKVRAYDADNGKVLWTGVLPAGSIGIPAMYESHGRQYLVINATQAGFGGRGAAAAGAAPGQRAYIAFALPSNK